MEMQKKEILETEMRGWQDGSEQEWDLNLDPQHPFKSLGHAFVTSILGGLRQADPGAHWQLAWQKQGAPDSVRQSIFSIFKTGSHVA